MPLYIFDVLSTNVSMSTLHVWWYISNKTKPLCMFDDISTKESPTYSLLALVLMYHPKCKVALRCCWYIIKHATCSLTLLLIYHRQCKVAFACLMIYQQKCQWALCMFINVACENNKKSAPTQLNCHCATHKFNVSPLFRLHLCCMCCGSMSCWKTP